LLQSYRVAGNLDLAELMACRLSSAAVVALLAALAAIAAPASAPALFSSSDILNIGLNAPFNQLFDAPEGAEDFTVAGTLSYIDGGQKKTIDGVRIGLRGHTSRKDGECTFPKLKVQLPHGAGGGTPFSGVSKIKIGTHCGESTDGAVTSKYGRLPNERSPHREALVYRLLDAFGVLTLKARPARVTYTYTDVRPGQKPNQTQPLVRNAFLLEDDDDAVKRLGGRQQIDEKGFTNARDRFTPDDTASIVFAEAMIGNFDWCLKMDPADRYRCDARHPLWNVVAVVGANGRARPLIYDFDVSGAVAGGHRWFADVYNEAFLQSRSHPTIEVLGQVERARSLFDRRVLDATRERFSSKKNAAYDLLGSAPLDSDGRHRIKEYLDAFFEAIGSDEAFYRPAVVAHGTMPYADASRARTVCPAQAAIPVGTVVSDPLQTSDRLIQVILLDTLWHWSPETKCVDVHKAPVWIEAGAVSREYPKDGVSERSDPRAPRPSTRDEGSRARARPRSRR
jgi:hypothetical protein